MTAIETNTRSPESKSRRSALDILHQPSVWHLWVGGIAASASEHRGRAAPTFRSARRGLARRRIRAADAGAFVWTGMGLEVMAFPPLFRRECGCFAGCAGCRAPSV